jgi:hypothetical protein
MAEMTPQEDIETPCPDPMDLAVLLEGGLRPARRRRLLHHIGGCEACYETFTGSARFLLDNQRSSSIRTADAVPPPRSATAPMAAAAALAAAIACALVLAGPRADRVRWAARSATRQVASIALQGPLAEQVVHPWSYLRGAGASEVGWRSGFRIGVLLSDLTAALSSGDRAAAEGLAPELRRLARDLEVGGSSLDGLFDGLVPEATRADGPRTLGAGFELAAARMGGSPAWDYVRLGAWAEAGRLAALAGDRRYFQRPSALRPPASLKGLELPELVEAALNQSLEAVRARTPLGLDQLHERFTALVTAGGRYASEPS